MAKGSLNKVVDTYFKSISRIKPEDITVDIVKKHLDIKATNEYGGLAHAIVNYDYDKDKILKTIEILLDMGLDPNYRSKMTGYTFIHLALYGYTNEKEEDVSYSTEFIVSLINMAKQNGLNVNIKDGDGDTIVHTSLASEVYTGSVISIMTALMPKFKLDSVDNDKKGIIEALDAYIYVSKRIKNKTWQERLLKEKEAITAFVKKGGKTEEELLSEKEKLDQELNVFLNSLTIDNLSLKQINELKQAYEDLNNLLTKNKFDLKEIENKINTKISLLIENNLKNIITNPTLKKINDFINLINKFSFYTPSIDINKVMTDYKAKLNEYENRANKASSLDTINQVKISLNNLLEEELKTKLNKILDDKVTLIKTNLTILSELYIKNNELIKFLEMNEITKNYQENTITIEEIEGLINVEQKRYSTLVDSITDLLNKKLKEVISPFQTLVDKNLISELKIDLNSANKDKQKVKNTK